MFSVIGQVFSNVKYIVLAISIATIVFTFAVWLPNFQLIGLVISSSTASVIEKINFLLSLYGSIGTNFTVISAWYTIMIAVLFGIQIALLTYYIRKVRGGMQGITKAGAVSVTGLISGVFGIGCAACGTFILTSLLALFGATGVLAFLPFGGEEFGILGVLLLLYSIFLLLKKINSPLVCEIA